MSLVKNAHLQNYSCQNAYLVKTQKDIAKIYDILNVQKCHGKICIFS